MKTDFYAVIRGTGSYIPTRTIHNDDFLNHQFFDNQGNKFDRTNTEIIEKFQNITGITERRYVTDDLVTSDISFFAARDALESAGISGEDLDLIIVAHNFGDVRAENRRSDFVPSIAARVKHKLKIKNPRTIAHDLPFGCPGWLQGVIQASWSIRSGAVTKALVIGAETLSRISDPHDRDSMIYADGAGAVVMEAIKNDQPVGVLSFACRSDTFEEAYMLWMGKSNNPNYQGTELFLKMDGHKLYEYALRTVPLVVKESLDKAGLSIGDLSKVLLHQANDKMDWGILKRLFHGLYNIKEIPDHIMPMTISWLGNSSVATLPTLYDLLLNGKLPNHSVKNGDTVVFGSVGAGMNINSVVYKIY